MKKFFSVLFVAVFAIPLIGFSAESAKAGAYGAVRGETQSTVYWYAPDGKRYVFPNAATYFTWFPNFTDVVTVPDNSLQTWPIGANVTYRPGAKLVKSATNPKVYAVSRGGVLRHIVSASVAKQLYGQNWGASVQNIPDVFFTDYTIGAPIYSTYDYNVSNEYNSVTWPHDSLRGASLNPITLTADRTSITSGQAVYLQAAYNGNVPQGGRIEIRNARTGKAVGTCFNLNRCAVTVYPVNTTGYATAQYNVNVKNAAGSTIATQSGPIINFTDSSTQSGSYQNDGKNYVTRMTLETDRTNVNSGDLVRLTANAFNVGNWSYAGNRIEIRDLRNGSIVRSCLNQSWCVAQDVSVTGAAGSKVQYGTLLFDRYGRLIMSRISPVITLNTGSTVNTGTGASSGAVTATASIAFHPSSDYRVNSTVFVNVDVQTTNLATRDLVVRIYDERSGTPIATCNGALTCIGVISTGSTPFSTRVYGLISSASLAGSVETQRLPFTITN